ncbi:glycosyltransferase [Halomonas litopenaei]|uniref:glycosyltransferase n=1 Tax=Halomonas litopenaei TaxID=2109328 RepID=UPI001A8DCBD1|nr:glycosyltransferase [Halomonas litopenaei]MBN8410990.1 glycosyltransferase [Halomonas litopenaei]
MISVLISVYKNDVLTYFKESIESVISQINGDDELVIVFDGPVAEELEQYAKGLDGIVDTTVKVVSLQKNLGLAKALNVGLEYCSKKYVARMDADDVSRGDRFAKQLSYMETNPTVSVVGGAVCEFTIDGVTKIKKGAESNKIVAFSKTRNPLNHPTVMFRKKDVLSVGGYNEKLYYAQDYELWCRMINEGFCLVNLDDVLVDFRLGENFLTKRSGFRYVRVEAKLLSSLVKLDYFSSFDALRFMIFRIPPRLLPTSILKLVYRTLRK